ncbi:odorant receptor 13a-like [Cotesia typhae]|uniref:odorant receptor 13a-like n=1 Tax=Cotesia typhae TaxID=2053667 RepID=UPI003D683006
MILILITLSFFLILSIVVDIKNSHDLSSFAKLDPLCFHLIGFSKWITGLFHLNEIKDLVLRMKRCHKLCLNYNESETDYQQYNTKIIKFNNYIKKFTYLWLLICIGGMIQWCFNPIIQDFFLEIFEEKKINSTSSRTLPFPGEFPWIIDSTLKYILTFTFQFFSSLSTAFELAIFDVLNVILLANVCFNFQHLNEILAKNHADIMIMRFSSDDKSTLKFKSKLKNCIVHHQEVLIFIAKLKDVFSYPMFIVCLDSTIALCLVSFEASTIKINSSVESITKLINMVQYWIGIVTELFIYCFLATKIEDLGLKTADAIYVCNWEQSMVNYRDNFTGEHRDEILEINQMVKFSIMRAQKPIIINGGLFYVLSLQTFKALVGLSLSNAIVLRQLAEET